MKTSLLKHITIACAVAVALFITTAFFISRLFELNYYNDIRISVENRMKEKDSFAESMLVSLSQIGAVATPKTVDRMAQPIFKESQALYFRAFIVRTDGTIVTHSDPQEAVRLNGNIATDEFSYNLEEIYYPITRESAGAVRRDYHILQQKIPFDDAILETLRSRVDSRIDRNGILYTKRIKLKSGAFFIASVILSRSDIYAHIGSSLDNLTRLKIFIILSCFSLSAVVAIFLFITIRRGENNTVAQLPDTVIQQELSEEMPAVEGRTPGAFSVRETPAPCTARTRPVIQDAIPIRKRGVK